MNDQINIRTIETADAEIVSLLATQHGYKRSTFAVRDWIEALHRELRTQTAFVACIEDDVIGWIEISIEHPLQSSPFAFIGGLVVESAFRNRGIRRLLCAHAEAWAWRQGVEKVRIHSHNTSHDAHHFYLDAGYHEGTSSRVFEKSRPA